LREATIIPTIWYIIIAISIHASLAGSDTSNLKSQTNRKNFNPRFPCGKRPAKTSNWQVLNGFQSTLPLREATDKTANVTGEKIYFNPRFPCGKRPTILILQKRITRFQSTLPLREATIN